VAGARAASLAEIISKTTAKPRKNQPVKRVSFKSISAMALLALTVGCSTTQTSSNTQSKESMLVASGFKIITPKNAAQQQKLQNLPPNKVAMIQKSGKTYYVFPDAAHNQAYVGGPAEYQAYKQLRAANNANNTVAVVSANEDTVVIVQGNYGDWAGYGGWGAGWGPRMGMGMGVGMRRF
jgi:hypothetical protein